MSAAAAWGLVREPVPEEVAVVEGAAWVDIRSAYPLDICAGHSFRVVIARQQ